MAEVLAVTGYVSDEVAKQLRDKAHGTAVEVSPDRGQSDVFVRVDGASIREARVGSSTHGQTLVQLILKDGASFESVVRHRVSAEGVRRFFDPAVARIAAAAIANVIEA